VSNTLIGASQKTGVSEESKELIEELGQLGANRHGTVVLGTTNVANVSLGRDSRNKSSSSSERRHRKIDCLKKLIDRMLKNTYLIKIFFLNIFIYHFFIIILFIFIFYFN
jgi:hypothetical protein